ncbi:MAG TPA: hypothetical protein P5293_00935 [Bacteroidales bacterium]|nr:hypothetical protein [Bacteroidales bacterium]
MFIVSENPRHKPVNPDLCAAIDKLIIPNNSMISFYITGGRIDWAFSDDSECEKVYKWIIEKYGIPIYSP